MKTKRLKAKTGISRACSKCGGDVGETRYLKQRYCKACHAASMRAHRPKHRDLPDLARKKANARSYAHVYVKRGKIQRENCKNCGSPNSQIHHPDYDKPTQVEWYCRPCHLALHKAQQPIMKVA